VLDVGAWDDLATALEGAELGANVYPAASDQIRAPAIVIRPDDPWITPGPAFGGLTEHYLALAAAPAGDPISAQSTIHGLVTGIVDALPDGFALVDVGAIALDESTGTPLLAARVRLAYT
jgi:hypothetical protein